MMDPSDTPLQHIPEDLSISSPSFFEDVSKFIEKVIQEDDAEVVPKLRSATVLVLNKTAELKINKTPSDKCDDLIKLHNTAIEHLCFICNRDVSRGEDAFKTLIQLLPLQTVINKKTAFPDERLAEILKVIILSKLSISKYLSALKELMLYPDVSQNIWKGLEIACCRMISKLSPDEVGKILEILNCTEIPKSNRVSDEFGPHLYFCRTQDGVLTEKDIGACVKKIWGRLASVDLPPKLMQALLLTLLERLMPRMKRPIFLTDFFITTLEYGGSISILALQGIFNLYKDENMNYPDIYRKLYSMVSPEMFDTQYKARFFYLIDIFLSSSHLPEALVASFIKKFSRLSLVSQPCDAVILLSCAINLLIRHRGLKKLRHNPIDIIHDSDPYDPNEEDPSQTRAVDSSLWEFVLLQNHFDPTVSSVAHKIHHEPFPTVEIDLSSLLETTTQEMFMKEQKKKMKNPPVTFEKPNSLLVPNIENNIFHIWNLNN